MRSTTGPKAAGAAATAALCLFVITGGALSAATPAGDEPGEAAAAERLHYRWRVRGLEGFLVWFMLRVPISGEGVLSTWSDATGRLRSEFRATSPGAAPEDHWTYVSEIDVDARRTLAVAESLRFRGREKDKSFDLAAETAVDGMAVLQLLRLAPPKRTRRYEIWSRGRIYPVVVIPQGRVRTDGGERWGSLRLYTVRGVREEGRKFWSAEAQLWFTDGNAPLPVEIRFRRPLGSARLTLVAHPL